jgi:phage shock protein A
MSLGARLSELLGRGRRTDEDDPMKALDASWETQAALLQQSRRGLADIVTARKRVELQVRGLEHSAQRLHEQAAAEVTSDREDAARELLLRRAELQSQAAALQPDLDRLADQESRLQAQVQRLEAKVEAFRVQKETLQAGYSAAEAHARIGEAYAGMTEESADVGLALERARARTEQMQARADAVEQLGAAGAVALPWESPGEQAERRMAELAEAGVDDELARLRSGGTATRGDAEAAR